MSVLFEVMDWKASVRTFAPGRIEFIGNHTDYNGGLVMGAAVNLGITVEASLRNDREVHLMTAEASKEMFISDYADLRVLDGEKFWGNYPLGVFYCMQVFGMKVEQGFNLRVKSDLPAGAGMSSSAALELATAYALSDLYGFSMDRKTIAQLCRQAEREFVGVPCGILDQGVSSFGEKDHLVLIDCKKEAFDTIKMPEGTHFWIFNSGKSHSLIDSLYAKRNEECMEAFVALKRIHAEAECLVDISSEDVKKAKSKLPTNQYSRALHVCSEHERVLDVVEALRANDLLKVGGLLNASHESSQTLFENSTEMLDFLVDELNKHSEVYGARLTGGGFGGAVMAFTSSDFEANGIQHKVAESYKRKFGEIPEVIKTEAGKGAKIL